MPQSNFPFGFAAGLTVRGIPLLQTNPGNVFWVGNSSTLIPQTTGGVNGNKGTFIRPFATIQAAVDACQANTGDIIFVKPGHAESISSAAILILSKAGISIIGLGTGSSRPTLTFTTAATANIPVTAANISIQNIAFVANFADIASVFTVTTTSVASNFNVENCSFTDISSVLNFITIVTGNATANSLSGLRFANNRIFSSGTTAASTVIKLLSATTQAQINDNFYVGAVLNNTACLLAHAANVVLNLQMVRNQVVRPNTDTATGGFLITTSATTNTGIIADNYCNAADVAAPVLVTASSGYTFSQNFFTGDADTSGYLLPAAGAP